MKRYELKICRYDTFCELCSEYHEYISCPICGGEILEIYERKVAHCSNGHLLTMWSRGTKVVIVDCEYLYRAKFAKAGCAHLEIIQTVGNGRDSCCEEGCPLVGRECKDVFMIVLPAVISVSGIVTMVI